MWILLSEGTKKGFRLNFSNIRDRRVKKFVQIKIQGWSYGKMKFASLYNCIGKLLKSHFLKLYLLAHLGQRLQGSL